MIVVVVGGAVDCARGAFTYVYIYIYIYTYNHSMLCYVMLRCMLCHGVRRRSPWHIHIYIEREILYYNIL